MSSGIDRHIAICGLLGLAIIIAWLILADRSGDGLHRAPSGLIFWARRDYDQSGALPLNAGPKEPWQK